MNNPNQQQQHQPNSTYQPLQQFPPSASGQQYTPAPPTWTGQQQSSNNNVVVSNQPTGVAQVTVTSPIEKPNPSVFIVTVILMSLCTLCGMVHLLVCLVPALIFSVLGFNYGYSKSRGMQQQAKMFSIIAIILDVVAVVFYCLGILIILISMAVLTGYF